MSHFQVVVHIPGSAAGIGYRGSCARGRRDCQEPSLWPPWMVWAAAGSAPGFILLRWVTGAASPCEWSSCRAWAICHLLRFSSFPPGSLLDAKWNLEWYKMKPWEHFVCFFISCFLVSFVSGEYKIFSMKTACGILQAKLEQVLIQVQAIRQI